MPGAATSKACQAVQPLWSMIMPLACSITRPVTGSTARCADLLHPQPGPLAYTAGLQRLAAPGTGLDIDIAYTREAPAGWSGPVGRLNARQLPDLAGPPAASQQCFICGAAGFVEAPPALLAEQGIADRQIRTGRFGSSGGTP
jgi:ferredoxin-NADP reductase